jgi:hypothetical protein
MENAPADSIFVLCCLYCGEGRSSMMAFRDGRFVCWRCGHTVRPGVPDYECLCRSCLDRSATKQTASSANR